MLVRPNRLMTKSSNNANITSSSMAADFTTGSLDPRITFSRASNATVTNSSGLITYAPHNLLTYSEQFDNSAWVKGNSSVTANAIAAPDGTTTADKLVENTAVSVEHFLTVAAAGGIDRSIQRTISVYVKLGERQGIRIQDNAFSSNYTRGFFNISTLTASTAVAGNGVASNATITSVGSGWYRCSYVSIPNTTSGGGSDISITLIDTGTNTTYTGNGTSGIYVWGAQLNVGSLQPYYPTTVKNLLGYSEAFDNAAWTKSNATVTANAVAAPNGTMTADKLVEDSAAGTEHRIGSTNITWTGNAIYTLSFYAKAAERSRFDILFGTAGNWVNGDPARSAQFNLSTGTVSVSPSSPSVASIVSVGDGWYRCQLTVTAVASPSASSIFLRLVNSSGNVVYNGDGTSGIYIWGAQISDSASLDTYVNNPVAAPTAAAYYGPRFDYDPVTLQPKGLLIEEQRTNLQIRSEEFNVNTTWQPLGGSVTANTTTSPDGTVDADTFTEDTANTNHALSELSTSVTSGVTYTSTVYAKAGTATVLQITGRATPFGLNVWANFNLSNGTVGAIGSSTTASIQAVGNGWYRCIMTGAAVATTTGSVAFTLTNNDPNAARFPSYTGTSRTILLWGAQVEAGAFATSYIPTTSAQVTRSADVALIQGSNFSSWYNQSEGTFAYQGDVASITSSGNIFLAVANDNTYNNSVGVFLPSSGGTGRFLTNSGGTFNGLAVSTNSVTINVPFKLAGTYKTNDLAVSLNGQAIGVDSTATIPSALTRLDIGSDQNGINRVGSGHIRSLAYYPRRLSNQELQGITA